MNSVAGMLGLSASLLASWTPAYPPFTLYPLGVIECPSKDGRNISFWSVLDNRYAALTSHMPLSRYNTT